MAQGLDRLITLGIETAGYRDDNGRWVPGATMEHSIWATRMDKPWTTSSSPAVPEASPSDLTWCAGGQTWPLPFPKLSR